MLNNRAIPCLLLRGSGFVKTTKFKKPVYLGDPINIVKIFNEKEVDEIVILDVDATEQGRGPNFDILSEIATECFIPLAYGGGIRSLEHMQTLFSVGIEKVIVNSAVLEIPSLIEAAAEQFGSQSIVVSIDVRKDLFGRIRCVYRRGRKTTKYEPADFAQEMERAGAGELLLHNVDRDGTMMGYDIELIRSVAEAVRVPVIACGGAASLRDLKTGVVVGGASAVAAGSLFVYQGKHKAVLINYPSQDELRSLFA